MESIFVKWPFCHFWNPDPGLRNWSKFWEIKKSNKKYVSPSPGHSRYLQNASKSFKIFLRANSRIQIASKISSGQRLPKDCPKLLATGVFADFCAEHFWMSTCLGAWVGSRQLWMRITVQRHRQADCEWQHELSVGIAAATILQHMCFVDAHQQKLGGKVPHDQKIVTCC